MHAVAFRISRLVFWVALCLYVGGLFSLGTVAAPKIFATLREHKFAYGAAPAFADTPEQLGGDIAENMFSGFRVREMVYLSAIILALVAETFLLRGAMLRKPWHLIRVALIVCVAGLLAWDGITTSSIYSKREEWCKAEVAVPADPAKTQALKAEFDSVHATSVWLAHTKAYLLLAALGLTALASTFVPPMLPKKQPKPQPQGIQAK